jgi:hypothetical protein
MVRFSTPQPSFEILEIQKYLLKSKEGKKNLISRKIGKLGDVVNQWSFSSRFMTTTKQLFLSNRRKLIRGGGVVYTTKLTTVE